MALRFDPSGNKYTDQILSTVGTLAVDEYKKDLQKKQAAELLKQLQDSGMLGGLTGNNAPVAAAAPASPTAGWKLSLSDTGPGGLTGAMDQPSLPPSAAMSMSDGSLGDANGNPIPAQKSPMVQPPVAQRMPLLNPTQPAAAAPVAQAGSTKAAPFIVNPISAAQGKLSLMKNPAYNNKTASVLSGFDMSQVPKPETPEERKQIIDTLPPEIGENVKMVGTYQMDMNKLTSLRGGSEDRLKFDALVSRLYPDMVGEKGFDYTEYVNRQNFQKSFFDPNRPTGQAINAIKQVTYHLGDLHDNVTALEASQSPLLNKPLQWWEKNAAGDPQISAVLTNLTAVNEELTKAWAGNNNGEARVREWQKSLGTANSPEQWKAVMSTAAGLLQGAVKTRQSQYKATMKRDINILDPDQKDILDNLKSSYTPAAVTKTGGAGNAFTPDQIAAELKRRGLK